ncbi:MAG: XRE family transcriptional regulator [Phenylobacterium sp.]|uniref:helix-turn-helix domain-containing protein n=1 Tax=Phenylobacterium sp. TaxID=1871053 RepID=UPI0012215F90|nr:helix-turn-helix transcriptional regulator [Phenylobacterium sp.]TAJ69092.1 MAG: XRE family transcriptional regulator [Phenylobacterium sp.]
MALFFDAPWFDAKLEERDLSRAVLAAVAGLSEAELALVFKDQQELSAGQVSAFAELLGVSAAEIADRAGISTPTPGKGSPTDARIAALERRVADLEAEIARLKGDD